MCDRNGNANVELKCISIFFIRPLSLSLSIPVSLSLSLSLSLSTSLSPSLYTSVSVSPSLSPDVPVSPPSVPPLSSVRHKLFESKNIWHRFCFTSIPLSPRSLHNRLMCYNFPVKLL